MSSELSFDSAPLAEALAGAGRNDALRNTVFESLRRAELESTDPESFRDSVRWPMVTALLQQVKAHRVTLQNGLVFEIGLDSRIEKALLLSLDAQPDHIWEPQTTRLLVELAAGASHVVVGGAYIGDQALPIAVAAQPDGLVHAFEPMQRAHERLLRNIRLNSMESHVLPRRLSLWDVSDVRLSLSGDLALASSGRHADTAGQDAEQVTSITITDYATRYGARLIDLITLDIEGGEERALLGATDLLKLPVGQAPNIVFEIHREYVDWTGGLGNTSVVQMLRSYDYELFAIRDVHGNFSLQGEPIEVIPVDTVYLEGPPHGFNVLAIKDVQLLGRVSTTVVNDVSPKLIPDKDPALHHPTGGFPRRFRGTGL